MVNTYSKMFQKIKNKGYRNRFIQGQIRAGIPFQVRALRAANKMTQKQLGEEAKLPQTVVSRIENGSGGSLSIKTLLKLAEAFDVALVVRFEPIDKLIDWVDNLSPEAQAPEPSEKVLVNMERGAINAEETKRELEKWAADEEATPIAAVTPEPPKSTNAVPLKGINLQGTALEKTPRKDEKDGAAATGQTGGALTVVEGTAEYTEKMKKKRRIDGSTQANFNFHLQGLPSPPHVEWPTRKRKDTNKEIIPPTIAWNSTEYATNRR